MNADVYQAALRDLAERHAVEVANHVLARAQLRAVEQLLAEQTKEIASISEKIAELEKQLGGDVPDAG